MKPKIISKKIEHVSGWVKVEGATIRLPDGKTAVWQRIMGNDFVAVVAIDKKKNIYLANEWRFAWEKDVLQIPAGVCNGTSEKALLKQARNELREEIGFDAKKWDKLLSCPFDSREKKYAHLFLAQDLFPSKKQEDEGEIIQVVKMPFGKAYKLFLSGKVLTTSYSILGMALAKEKLKL